MTITGDFTLTATSAPPTIRTSAGDQAPAHIAVTAIDSFTSLITVSVAPTVPGITATLGAPFLAPGANTPLTFRLATIVTPGLYAFTVTGEAQVDGRTVTRSAAVNLEVLPPDAHAVTGRIMTAASIPQPPIAIQRNYSSSTAVTGLFGRGWNLETDDTRINQTAGLLTLVLPNQSFSRFVQSSPGQLTNASEPFTFLLHVLRTAGVQVPSAGFQPAWLLPRVRGQEYPGATQTGPIQGP